VAQTAGTHTHNSLLAADTSLFGLTADSKAMFVGVPTNSAVGKHLAAACGPLLTTLTATRVQQLDPVPGTSSRPGLDSISGQHQAVRGWRLQLESKSSSLTEEEHRWVMQLRLRLVWCGSYHVGIALHPEIVQASAMSMSMPGLHPSSWVCLCLQVP
jgi:hypothetical protein